MPIRPYASCHYRVAVLCLALAACTAPPVFRTTVPPLDAAPEDVARAPERYQRAEVVWGGSIVEVRNRSEASELVILAYPLDGGQRPQPKENSQGRFIAVLPGYVESFDYPQGRFVSLIGRLDGSRVEAVDGHDYVYPLVASDSVHLWPPGFEKDGPRVHFAIGISGAIR